MERKAPTPEERAQFREFMKEMISARMDMQTSLAPKYAQFFATFRKELEKAGFSAEDSMQIVLKVAEQQRGPQPFFGGGFRGRWHKEHEEHKGHE